jgi:release factor glutamine methyltransferase
VDHQNNKEGGMKEEKDDDNDNDSYSSDIYNPAEDTFMLASAVDGLHGDDALEIGTGSGYIASILSKGFKRVVATDINLEALIYAKSSNYSSGDVEFVCCNSADAISGISFDLIAVNPPYLPSERIEDATVDGGRYGIEVAMSMLKSASRLLRDDGRIIMVISSLARYDLLLSSLHGIGLEGRITARKRYGFEDLLLIEMRSIKHATQQHQDHQG